MWGHTGLMGEDSAGEADLQTQLDELARRVEANRADIDALRHRADTSDTRSDVADARADAADVRADAADVRADAADVRADDMEARARVDRDMIAELQAEGVLSREHAQQLDQALKTSRTIGAALGMIMANRQVSEDEAFAILRKVSQNSNRKLRELAEELVASGGAADVVS